MEEQNLGQDQIINNQVVPKKKIVGKWTLLLPLLQVLCVFIVLGSALCGMDAPSSNPFCSLVVPMLFYSIFILPFFSLFLFFIKSTSRYNRITYPIITFLICSVIPLLFFANQFHMQQGFKKTAEKAKSVLKASLTMENYSITTEPATDITSHSATLNVAIKNLVNNIPPRGDFGFYLGSSKTKMDLILGDFCDNRLNLIDGFCSLDLSIRGGEPMLPLSPHTTYYFSGAIIFYEELPNGGTEEHIKKSDIILSFTTL